MLLFWLTPIIYDIRTVPEVFRTVLFMNPLSYFILAYQDVLFLNNVPAFERLAVIFLFTAVSLALGYKTFFACKRRFAEEG
jgi:ABC-type polysaccharide/polyol phosphate export permease